MNNLMQNQKILETAEVLSFWDFYNALRSAYTEKETVVIPEELLSSLMDSLVSYWHNED